MIIIIIASLRFNSTIRMFGGMFSLFPLLLIRSLDVHFADETALSGPVLSLTIANRIVTHRTHISQSW